MEADRVLGCDSIVDVSGLRAYIYVEADLPIRVFTGKVVKTLFYSLVREASMYRGLRGIVSLIHISPLFKPGRREWELGELVTPVYVRDRETGEYRVKPVELKGEYIIHIGGYTPLVEKAYKSLEKLKNPLQVKIGESIILYKLLKIRDVSKDICGKELDGGRLTIYFKAPVKLFNVFTPTRLPKYSLSAVEVLMTPYMFYTGRLTMDYSLLVEASRILGLLVETYYSINTAKPILVPLNNAHDPGLKGKATYILEARDDREKKIINKVLNIGEIVGIGESRQNGFGTISWTPK